MITFFVKRKASVLSCCGVGKLRLPPKLLLLSWVRFSLNASYLFCQTKQILVNKTEAILCPKIFGGKKLLNKQRNIVCQFYNMFHRKTGDFFTKRIIHPRRLFCIWFWFLEPGSPDSRKTNSLVNENKKKIKMALTFIQCANIFFILACLHIYSGATERQRLRSVGCFVCTSFNHSNPDCEDPFVNRNNLFYHKKCWSSHKHRIGVFPATQCIKMVATDYKTGYHIVVRNCVVDNGGTTSESEIGRQSHCGWVRVMKYNNKYYHGCVLACDYDGCNAASTFAIKPPHSHGTAVFYLVSLPLLILSREKLLC